MLCWQLVSDYCVLPVFMITTTVFRHPIILRFIAPIQCSSYDVPINHSCSVWTCLSCTVADYLAISTHLVAQHDHARDLGPDGRVLRRSHGCRSSVKSVIPILARPPQQRDKSVVHSIRLSSIVIGMLEEAALSLARQ